MTTAATIRVWIVESGCVINTTLAYRMRNSRRRWCWWRRLAPIHTMASGTGWSNATTQVGTVTTGATAAIRSLLIDCMQEAALFISMWHAGWWRITTATAGCNRISNRLDLGCAQGKQARATHAADIVIDRGLDLGRGSASLGTRRSAVTGCAIGGIECITIQGWRCCVTNRGTAGRSVRLAIIVRDRQADRIGARGGIGMHR